MTLLRDPLLHFLAGGAALFLLYALVGGDTDRGELRIVVTEARVASLAAAFERTWMRPPSPVELKGLVDDYVREEVLYREALALGLDRDDLVVRRRMRQKMEFLTAELEEPPEPTDEELEAYLASHAERFRTPPRWSFDQVFVASGATGDDAEARARRLLAVLRADAAARVDGDPTLLPSALERAAPAEIERTFGTAFATAVQRAEPGAWTDPVPSPYGLHLVRVRERLPARTPALAEVRAAVERDLTAERRRESEEAAYLRLRQRYEVDVRMPTDAPADLAGAP